MASEETSSLDPTSPNRLEGKGEKIEEREEGREGF